MTTEPDDIAFAKGCIERLHAVRSTHPHGVMAEAKRPGWSFEDGGAPAAMWDGEPGSDGYVRWKPVPSSVSPADVAAIEAEYGFAFPSLMRAMCLAPHHLFDQLGDGEDRFLWPDNPNDNPLGPLRERLETWRPLIAAGYLPFAEWGDGYGPACLDSFALLPDGDMAVVKFAFEDLPLPGPDGNVPRTELEGFAQPLYPSFRVMISRLFLCE